MMKYIFVKIVLLFLSAVIFFGCENSENINEPNVQNRIYGSGKIVTEFRNLSDCNGIILTNIGTIYLKQGNEQSVIIEADDNIIDRLITKEENGALVAGLSQGTYSNITLRIYLSLKTVKNISIESAGTVECTGPIHSDSLYCLINGAGKLKLEGDANFLNCIIIGAGSINAKNFIAEKSNVVVTGAGSCIIYVTNELYAVVDGIGSIIYYGNPGIVKTSISGLGQIRRGN